MAPHMISTSAWAALSFALAGVCFLAGYRLGDDNRADKCERLIQAQERQRASETAAALARAQEAAIKAAQSMAAQRAAASQRLKEARREIDRLAAGRECLSGALRVRISDAAAGVTDNLPEDPGPSARAAAEPAADPGDGIASTDADVAAWALDVASAYEECRARIDAIRQWDQVTHGR
ncbi:hypothetical protein [Azohydromonas sediminis]|uniref:hypothetical protein n=1 Tax=Azohydromonas sediminis TaxID=2259674 RepID=UPI000E64E7B6|nr:hypothetical protein [Azohydromonas sediminis]